MIIALTLERGRRPCSADAEPKIVHAAASATASSIVWPSSGVSCSLMTAQRTRSRITIVRNELTNENCARSGVTDSASSLATASVTIVASARALVEMASSDARATAGGRRAGHAATAKMRKAHPALAHASLQTMSASTRVSLRRTACRDRPRGRTGPTEAQNSS